jgi:choline dehydrogenase-like flavoprotein
MEKSPKEGVVDVNFEVHNYAGLFIIDGSIMPASPGVTPQLDHHCAGRICDE